MDEDLRIAVRPGGPSVVAALNSLCLRAVLRSPQTAHTLPARNEEALHKLPAYKFTPILVLTTESSPERKAEDNGAGLNTDRILAEARQQGLVREDETLTLEQIHELSFQPGLSTASVVADVSGRRMKPSTLLMTG